MTFESIFITTLFGTELTVEFEFLETSCFHAVGEVFDGSTFCFGHD